MGDSRKGVEVRAVTTALDAGDLGVARPDEVSEFLLAEPFVHSELDQQPGDLATARHAACWARYSGLCLARRAAAWSALSPRGLTSLERDFRGVGRFLRVVVAMRVILSLLISPAKGHHGRQAGRSPRLGVHTLAEVLETSLGENDVGIGERTRPLLEAGVQ